MRPKTIPAWILSFCLIASGGITTAQALTPATKSDSPVTIVSNKAKVNNKTGNSVFIGDVEIIQGTSRLNADQVDITMTADKKIDIAIATGAPAVYRSKEPGKPEVIAKADRLEYHANSGKIFLIGNAVVTQGENVFKGPRIEYDMNTELVTSNGNSSKGGRTQIVIVPGDRASKK